VKKADRGLTDFFSLPLLLQGGEEKNLSKNAGNAKALQLPAQARSATNTSKLTLPGYRKAYKH
jgi:hypothetical protein